MSGERPGSIVGAGVLAALMLVPTAWSQVASEIQHLVAEDNDPGDHFGSAIDVDGPFMVIGAKDDTEGGSLAGAAYVYEQVGAEWIFRQKLLAGDAEDFALFGTAVAIDGDLIVVGARRMDKTLDGGGVIVDVGRVYGFHREGETWSEVFQLEASDPFIFDEFGSAVAVDGDRILVGAHQEGTACDEDPDPVIQQNCNSGAAYVFDFDGNEWEETAKIVAADTDIRDLFGARVALRGDLAIIGAWAEGNTAGPCPPNCSLDGPGAVYVYRKTGEQWTEEVKLTPPGGGQLFDYFGVALELDGDDTLLIGAEGDDEMAVSGGAAYVYRYDGDASQWALEQKLMAADIEFADFFGGALTLRGDFAVIGSRFDDIEGESNSGSAYVFEHDGNSWVERAQLVASDAAANDQLGNWDVAIAGTQTIVAAIADDAHAGSAYVYGGLDDCNDNGVLDLVEIAEGKADDADGNGVPDECEGDPIPGDLDGDGDVDVADLVELILSWGPCPNPCPPACVGDLNGDCAVGVEDLVALILNWT